MKNHILVVDDEKNIRVTLRSALEEEGYRVSLASDGLSALSIFEKENPDVVILDIWMEGIDGLGVLQKIKEKDSFLPVIMMSGHGTIETAVKATKLGAFDFVEKPLSLEKLLLLIQNVLSVKALREENKKLREALSKQFNMIVGSTVMKTLQQQIAVAAPTHSWVLITGENGTGKELVARSIHEQSSRASKNFVAVNCAAIPEDLIESELFGHEKGAFTGAALSKKGKFEMAHEGTLFLDEVGDMSVKTQAKILRVLQEKKFERVGGTETYVVDVRVVGATNKNLTQEITEGRFREDLYYRLNVIPLHIPPLRERREDIPLLVHFFLEQIAKDNGKKVKSISKEAMIMLEAYHWPGNVRELKNVVERLFIMTPSAEIVSFDVELSLREAKKESTYMGDYKRAKGQFEKEYLEHKLKEFEGNISKTAKEIGVERSHLHRKLKMYGIQI